MRKFDLFPTSVYLSKFERHNDVVKYMHEEILPSYTEYNNSTQCNVYSDYFISLRICHVCMQGSMIKFKVSLSF